MSNINYKYFGNKEDNVNISNILHTDEEVLWSAVPKQKAYVAEKVLKGAPFAILWLVFDIFFVIFFSRSGGPILMIIPFILIHLTPFWIWVYSIVKAKRIIKHEKYYVTSERLLVITGETPFVKSEVQISLISRTEVHQSQTDSYFGVSDLYVTGKIGSVVFNDILDAQTVKNKLDEIKNDNTKKEKFYQFSRTCEYCGSTVDKNLKKCPYCGATIELEYDNKREKF